MLGIDYFFGDPVHLHLEEPGFDRPTWVAKSQKQAAESVPKWIEGVQKIYGTTPLGPLVSGAGCSCDVITGLDARYSAVGYCFGAPYALEAAKNDKVVAGTLEPRMLPSNIEIILFVHIGTLQLLSRTLQG